MATYKYSVSTNVIWASFDFGEVVAENEEKARLIAIAKFSADFLKANDALAHCDNTFGFSLHFDHNSVTVEEVKKPTPFFYRRMYAPYLYFMADGNSFIEVNRDSKSIRHFESAFKFDPSGHTHIEVDEDAFMMAYDSVFSKINLK